MIEHFPLLPEELSIYQVTGLILMNLMCAFISTALSLGGGILMLVSLSFFLPPLALIPIHGVIQFGSNFSRIFVSFKQVEFKLIIPFVSGTLLGSYFGTHIIENISPSLGQIGVGLFILYSIFGKFPQLGKKFIFIGGIVSSTMSILFGASGPIVATFIRNLNFKPLKHVATHGAMMTFQHGLKCLAYFLIGFTYDQYLFFLILMILVGFIGTYLGRLFLISKGEKYFKKVLSLILFFGALRLIYLGLQDYL